MNKEEILKSDTNTLKQHWQELMDITEDIEEEMIRIEKELLRRDWEKEHNIL